MRIIAYDPYLPADASLDDVVLVPSLTGLLGESDVISLHVPLTPQTRYMFDAARLALIKPGALLINCGRGALVDETALIAALQEGKLAGAGMDVLKRNPDPGQPSSPHVSGGSDASFCRAHCCCPGACAPGRCGCGRTRAQRPAAPPRDQPVGS